MNSHDSIAIIIDPWENGFLKNVYRNISEFCYNNHSIKAVFVANYVNRANVNHDPLICDVQNNKSYYYFSRDSRLLKPARKYYSKKHCEKATDRIDHWWNTMNQPLEQLDRNGPYIEMIEMMGPIAPEGTESTLDPIILNMPIRKGQEILPVWTKSQMEYLIKHHWPRTRNIFMMGAAWEECVRNRPLGYLSIQDSINSGNLSWGIKLYCKDGTVAGLTPSVSKLNHPAWTPLPSDPDIRIYHPDLDCRSRDEEKYPWTKSIKLCQPRK